MKAELVPTNGDLPIPITRDVTVIGRRDFCDVWIDDPSLSKRHCVLVRTDGLLMLRDLVTTTGTKVNGQRVMWAALLPNDRLTIGGYKVRVYLGPDDAPSPSEQAARSARNAAPTTPLVRGATATSANGRGTAATASAARDDREGFATPTSDPMLIDPDDFSDDDDVIQLSDGDVAPLHDLVKLDDDDILDLR